MAIWSRETVYWTAEYPIGIDGDTNEPITVYVEITAVIEGSFVDGWDLEKVWIHYTGKEAVDLLQAEKYFMNEKFVYTLNRAIDEIRG